MARRADFDVFIDKFKPIERFPEQTLLWETYGEDYEHVCSKNENYIWTIITGDSGKMYITPGIHWINRMNYIICEELWQEGQRDYLY